jgi:hypothetical protein
MTHPTPGSQEVAMQGSVLIGHATVAPPPQTPAALQDSPLVHAFPSLHGAPGIGTLLQPPEAHESVVHGLPSSHTRGIPAQRPAPLHVSITVQASPSLQAPEIGVWLQAPPVPQPSIVHDWPSSQLRHVPPQHVWPAPQSDTRWQTSPMHVVISHGPARQLVAVLQLPG